MGRYAAPSSTHVGGRAGFRSSRGRLAKAGRARHCGSPVGDGRRGRPRRIRLTKGTGKCSDFGRGVRACAAPFFSGWEWYQAGPAPAARPPRGITLSRARQFRKSRVPQCKGRRCRRRTAHGARPPLRTPIAGGTAIAQAPTVPRSRMPARTVTRLHPRT